MNIFIYGSYDFKKDIQKILRDSKIEQILEGIKILEINKLDELKENIASNPDDIYLIDEDKIIKPGKFNFLKSKDAIEQDFLEQCGVDDLQVESLEDIPNYIERKYDKYIQEKKNSSTIKDEDLVLDSELLDLLESKNQDTQNNSTIENTILNDANEAKNIDIDELENLIDYSPTEENKNDFSELQNFEEDVGLNNISFDYDDNTILNDSSKDEDMLNDILNLANLQEDTEDLIENTFEDIDFLDEIFPDKKIISPDILLENKKEEIDEEDIQSLEHLISNIKSNEIEKIEHILDINEEKDSKIEKIKEDEGDDFMNDEFFELDSLNEQDLIEALSNEVESSDSNTNSLANINLSNIKKDEVINLNSSKVEEISFLISQLLNNKTLEITIKIKD